MKASKEFMDSAKRTYLQTLDFIRASGGSVHPSVFESAVEYGNLAGIPILKIRDGVLAAGIKEDDLDGYLLSSAHRRILYTGK